MSRLIRMDHTGHSTLAEWTAGDQAAYDAAVTAFRRELDAGLHRRRLRGRGPRDAGPRAAGRRRPRDHAPADRRRLALCRGRAPRARGRPLATPRDRPHAAHARAAVDADDVRPRRAVLRGRGRAVPDRAVLGAGRRDRARPGVDHPRPVRRARGRTPCGRAGPRNERRRARRPGPARRPAGPRRARAAAPDRPGDGARRAGRLAGRRARRAAGRARRPDRATASASRPAATSCRRRTGSPTCCWPCAPTSRASRPSRTTRSRALRGGCKRRLSRRAPSRRSTAAVREPRARPVR